MATCRAVPTFPSRAACNPVTSLIAWVWLVAAFPSRAACNPVTSLIAWVWLAGAAAMAESTPAGDRNSSADAPEFTRTKKPPEPE